MSKRKRLSYEKKLEACKLYEQGYFSFKTIAKKFKISTSGFEKLYFKYKNYGPDSLMMQKQKRSYTKEFKEQIVEEYKSGNYSYSELAIKYKIANRYIITGWVLGYNKSNKTTYSGTGGVTIMARKTTLEERIEIIKYLIDNEVDYNRTSINYNVSYQQVYTWYKKYQKFGVEGLNDNRGIKKAITELTEIELLRKENERLKRELELSKATEIVLKKKQELEEKAHLRELEMKNHIKR